ncbi:hypothetical protein [Microbacterium sp. Mcb102]|uniref:hypothetical protein n=1 Tax=Microbacterium sp. Mcb102 TaxID=2926012 RepID=UPI0021C76E72|nr:hypothetical protein [Microbacterium sp. Mcb102]
MAFKTRAGRTVSIGTGSMSTSIVLMMFSFVGLVAPAAVSLGFGAWLVWPDARAFAEDTLPAALALAIAVIGIQLLLRAGAACCYLVAFIGPRNNVRNHAAALARSRTGRYAILATAVSLALLPIMKYPFGDPRAFVIIFLTCALIVFDVLAFRGLTRISRTSRAEAFYDGMEEDEKRIADRPWPTSRRPSFPEPSQVASAEDARRYLRRAKDAAELHVWIGAGIIVIFTAFIGTSFSAIWEHPGPGPMIAVYVVLGFTALGFWLQRRARSYRALADDFAARASELEDHSSHMQSRRARLLHDWANRILGRGRGTSPTAQEHPSVRPMGGKSSASNAAAPTAGRGGRRRRTPNAAAGGPRRRSG